MKVNPVQSFNQMSTGKKVATVTGAAVATVAAASVIAAGVIGKGKINPELKGFQKVLPALKEGYIAMGQGIAKGAKAVGNFIADKFNKIKEKFAAKADEVIPEATEATTEAAAEAAEEILS